MQYGTIVVCGKNGKDYIMVGSDIVSPLFNSLAELLPWMKNNGWNWAEYDESGNNYIPWRVSNG